MTDSTSTPEQKLCAFGPIAERRPHWLLRFEDAEMGEMHFDSGDEAMAEYRRRSPQWNCTLYVTAGWKAREASLAMPLTEGELGAMARCAFPERWDDKHLDECMNGRHGFSRDQVAAMLQANAMDTVSRAFTEFQRLRTGVSDGNG